MNRMMIVGLMATLPALANAATPSSPLIAQAKKTISVEMIDPSSVQYRGLRTVHKSVNGKMLAIVCGEVNSKNRMGGYVGFAKFAYEPTVLHGAVSMNAEGGMDFYGESAGHDDDSILRLKAEVLMPCLNG